MQIRLAVASGGCFAVTFGAVLPEEILSGLRRLRFLRERILARRIFGGNAREPLSITDAGDESCSYKKREENYGQRTHFYFPLNNANICGISYEIPKRKRNFKL